MQTLFIVLSAIISILSPIVAVKTWKELHALAKVLLILVCVSSVVFAITQYTALKKSQREDRINSPYYDISDNSGTKPITKISIGKGGVFFVNDNGEYNFGWGKGVLIKTSTYKGKLFVDFIVRESNGEPIAVIEKNTITPYSDKYEYQNNDSAFEIVTKGERRVYFQIVLNNGYTTVSGVMLDKTGTGNVVSEGLNGGGAYLSRVNTGDTINNLSYEINRLFKYPREKYIGELAIP